LRPHVSILMAGWLLSLCVPGAFAGTKRDGGTSEPGDVVFSVEAASETVVLGQPVRLRGFATNRGKEALDIGVGSWDAWIVVGERLHLSQVDALYREGASAHKLSLRPGEKALCFDVEAPTGVHGFRESCVLAHGEARAKWSIHFGVAGRDGHQRGDSKPFRLVLDHPQAQPSAWQVRGLQVELRPEKSRVWSPREVAFLVRLRNVGEKPLKMRGGTRPAAAHCVVLIYSPGKPLPVWEPLEWPFGDGDLTLRPGETCERRFLKGWGLEDRLVPGGPHGHVGHKMVETTLVEPGRYGAFVAFITAEHLQGEGYWTGCARSNAVTVELLDNPFRKRGAIESAAIAPDTRLIALGGSDKTIRIRDVAAARETHVLTCGRGGEHRLAFSPDGKLLATGSGRLWDVESGKEVRWTQEYRGGGLAVAFSPDGRLLALCGEHHAVGVWEVSAGKELQSLRGHGAAVLAVAFSSDGKTLASGTSSYENTVKLWDVGAGRLVRTIPGHAGGVSEVAFSPDGRLLAAACCGVTTLWDVATGAARARVESGAASHHSLAFSPDGALLATGARTSNIRVWDVATGKLLLAPKRSLTPVYALRISPDGKTLVAVGEHGIVHTVDLAPIAARRNAPAQRK